MSRCPSRRVTTPMRRPSCSSSSWHTPMPGSTRLSTRSTITQPYLYPPKTDFDLGPSRKRSSRGPLIKILFAVFAVGAGADRLLFHVAQLDAPDLAADRLRQFGELQAANPLVGRKILPAVAQDVAGELLGRLGPGNEHDVGPGDSVAQLVGSRNDRCFG